MSERDMSADVYRAVVLNMWVPAPSVITYQISCIADTYIAIHNSSKTTVIKYNIIILWLGSAQHEELF